MTDDAEPQHGAQRKKYTFKKRDPVAAAKLEEERVASIKHNPFGDAKPRESVLAKRTGKDEATVVEEEALTYEVHFKLTPEQFAEKKARQGEIDGLKASLEDSDLSDADAVKAEITQKETELAELIKGFEALLVEKAKAGDLPRVERKPFMRGEEGGGGYGGGGYGDSESFRGNNRGMPYKDQYEPSSGGYGGSGFGDHDSNRGSDSFGAGYGSGGGGGGFNKRRGGRGGGGGGREYREAGGGFREEGGGGGGGSDGGYGAYGSRNKGNREGGGGGGYHQYYPMKADSEDYKPLSER